MSEFPTTRVSLLLRVKDPANQAAWEEFAAIYRPVIHRFARRRGLQEADAQDLSQTVLTAVAERIPDWTPDDDRAKFRTWLSRIAMNQTITMFRRKRIDAARGGTTGVAILNNQEDPTSDLQMDYRREIFRLAARLASAEFEETTWRAFWMTAVEGATPDEAAQSLHRSVGSIYTARSRVIRRLQQLAREIESEATDA